MIGSREFTEWQELHKQEPWGNDWEQAGTICAVLVNLWSKMKVDAARFVPRAKVPGKQDSRELELQMMQWARQHNAKIDAREELRRKK